MNYDIRYNYIVYNKKYDINYHAFSWLYNNKYNMNYDIRYNYIVYDNKYDINYNIIYNYIV